MSNYVVGDIQGCYGEFIEGLKLIEFDTSKDFLWITGDLINKGPDSLKVIKHILSIRSAVHIVLGNHDLHFLNCFYNEKSLSKTDTFESLINHKKVSIMASFLLKQPFVFSKRIQTKKRSIKVGMVHAGIPKNMSLKKAETLSKLSSLKLKGNPKKALKTIFERDKKNYSIDTIRGAISFFTRARVTKKNGLPNFSFKGKIKDIPSHLFPWFDEKNKVMDDLDYLVFGHWAALEGKTNLSKIIAMDTGCCWGKELTFLRLEDKKKFAVKSKHR
tara:strand:- start:1806 stop:2624 length:819 start_codon:yes stop_codon:yes gene_type:complete